MQLQNIQITGGLTFIPEILSPSGDPYWANVSLLMNTTSANAQTNNTFLDGSTNNYTITRVGTPTQGSFTPFALAPSTSYSPSINGGSGYFDGAANYLAFDGSSAFAFGTNPFTFEGWFYVSSFGATRQIFDARPALSAVPVGAEFTSTGAVSWYNGASRTSSTTANPNSWNHVAFVREGTGTNQFKIYLNGNVIHTFTDTVNYGTMSAVTRIGYNLSNTNSFFGYMASVRIVKGTAVYTGNFTPPTTPLTAISGTSLLLNFTNAGIFDSATKNNLTTIGDAKVSTTQSKFAPTSVVFDGTGDFLTTLPNNIFEMGSGNYTVEFWMYANNNNGAGLVFKGQYQTGESWLAGYGVRRLSASLLRFYFNTTNSNATEQFFDYTTTTSTNVWYHIAMVVSGGTGYAFVNGQLVGTRANITSIPTSNTGISIGCFPYSLGNIFFNGYIQDVRITKGVARYTANFTPPTEPFPTN